MKPLPFTVRCRVQFSRAVLGGGLHRVVKLWIPVYFTNAEGANLPAVAAETNFPVLVRLNSGNVNFGQAQSDARYLLFAIRGAGTVAQPTTAFSFPV